MSSYAHIANGIPQGSPLGPLVFNVFVNGLCSTSILYADELKLIRTMNLHNDSVILQEDINQVEEWCHENKMKINAYG